MDLDGLVLCGFPKTLCGHTHRRTGMKELLFILLSTQNMLRLLHCLLAVQHVDRCLHIIEENEHR
jgi:hypothetical protein